MELPAATSVRASLVQVDVAMVTLLMEMCAFPVQTTASTAHLTALPPLQRAPTARKNTPSPATCASHVRPAVRDVTPTELASVTVLVFVHQAMYWMETRALHAQLTAWDAPPRTRAMDPAHVHKASNQTAPPSAIVAQTTVSPARQMSTSVPRARWVTRWLRGAQSAESVPTTADSALSKGVEPNVTGVSVKLVTR